MPASLTEARWTAMELLPQQLWAMKFFVAAKGEGRKELRTSFIQIACAGAQRAKIGYLPRARVGRRRGQSERSGSRW